MLHPFVYIDLALKYCDEIILINSGKVIEAGKTKDKLTPEIIKKTFDIETIIKKVDNDDIIIYKE